METRNYENAAEYPDWWSGMNAQKKDRRDITVPHAFSPGLESPGYP